MSSARYASLPILLLLAAGCLQPGPMPEGYKVASGRDVGAATFLADSEGIPWGMVFSRRKAPRTSERDAVSDLWIAPLPQQLVSTVLGGRPPIPPLIPEPMLVIANRSDRWAPVLKGQSVFLMVDERQVTSGGEGKAQRETVATLVRIGAQYQSNLRFENISAFTAAAQDRLLFRQVPDGNETPGLFLWDGQEQRRLGDVANANELDAQFIGDTAYFILGKDRVLSRLRALTDSVQDLHANVSRYQMRGDEKYAALALSSAGATKTVIFDLEAGKDIPLARPNPCCWIGFPDDSHFTYSQSAGPDTPAEYHTLDVATGVDTALILPAPLVDYAYSLDRNSDEVLYLDSQGHGVFLGHDDLQLRRAMDRRMLSPRFSPDGQYLIYIDPQPITTRDPYRHGPLMVQDADLVNPPRQITPVGMSVSENSFFFIRGPQNPDGSEGRPILVFWAYVVITSTDLYFADHETGDLQVVAGAIGSVSVDSQQIFGTVHISAQDQVGDLVVQDVRDVVDNVQLKPIARAVPQFEYTQGYGMVGYVVRGRAPSDHDGLWVTKWPERPKRDGGQ